MVKYKCDNCQKNFTQKSHYTNHINRKNICKKVIPIEQIIDQRVKSILQQKDTKKEKFTLIEVCSGAGGLSLGFIRAGFNPILLNEIDKNCCITLKENHKNINIIKGDMRELHLLDYYDIDVLAGGIPCQSFSLAGLRDGLNDPRGELVFEFNRLINESMPKVFLIENVKGLISHNCGETIKQVINLFSNGGMYEVNYKVLNAVDYGVPQKRERVFIIGVREDITNNFKFPEKWENKLLLKDVLQNVPKSIGAKYPDKKVKIFEKIPPGGCWVDLPKQLQLEYMGQNMLNSSGGKRGVARRLNMNEPSLTLLTTPSQKQTERCHPIEIRPLNIREYARIQTFPDNYKFIGSLSSQYKQIGNAVPVNLAYVMAKQIRLLLENQ